jgi:DNA primase
MKYVLPTTHVVLGINNIGRRVTLRCPANTHRDSTPSFTVYPDGGFHCFGCNVSGKNGLDFVIKVLGNSYGESMDYLREKKLLTETE